MGITSTPMEISSKCVSLTYASLSKQLYYDLQCSIIHESFQNLVLLCSCSHCFCKAYIQAWLDRDKTCPTNCPLFISDVIQYYICQLALINCISSKEDLTHQHEISLRFNSSENVKTYSQTELFVFFKIRIQELNKMLYELKPQRLQTFQPLFSSGWLFE